MNLEGRKRINITCPKCHYDYIINGDLLFQEKRRLAEEVGIVNAKLKAFREENPNDYKKNPYYLKLKRTYAEKEVQLSKAKTEYSNGCRISESNLFIAFKRKCMQEFGREKIIQLLEECEEEMQYNDYDMAKQTYTNFNNV